MFQGVRYTGTLCKCWLNEWLLFILISRMLLLRSWQIWKDMIGLLRWEVKKLILYWAPPICQVRCQVFCIYSLSLILMTFQESLNYRQVIGESEKLDNFLKVWNGAEPRWKSWCVWASALSTCHLAPRGQFTHQFLRDFMGNVAHFSVLGAWKKLPMFCLPVLKSERAGVPGLDCGQKAAAPLGVWSTSPHSWTGQVGVHWDAPWGEGLTCYVISG